MIFRPGWRTDSMVLQIAREVRTRTRGWSMVLGGLPPAGEVRVSYGGVRAPAAAEASHGGIIKLHPLQRLFPESPCRFNVLYVVSSRPPHDVVRLAGYAKRKGARLVLNQNGVAYQAWYGPGWERANAPMAALVQTADFVFYQSEFCRRAADRFLGRRSGPAEVLHNAVDTERFRPAEPPSAPSRLRLLVAGTHESWYRIEAALRVTALVARDRDVELTIAGAFKWAALGSSAGADVAARASELQIADRVRVVGPYSQWHSPVIFQASDILLHTKYNDPCPTVVIEAMACGAPVIYSRSGGVPELVGDEAGVGIEVESSWERDVPPDPGRMAAAVLRVAAERARFAAAARRRAVEHLDVKYWLRRHAEVFKRIVAWGA